MQLQDLCIYKTLKTSNLTFFSDGVVLPDGLGAAQIRLGAAGYRRSKACRLSPVCRRGDGRSAVPSTVRPSRRCGCALDDGCGHLSGAWVESLGFVPASVLDFSSSLMAVSGGGEGTGAGRQRRLGRRVRVSPRAALHLRDFALSGGALG